MTTICIRNVDPGKPTCRSLRFHRIFVACATTQWLVHFWRWNCFWHYTILASTSRHCDTLQFLFKKCLFNPINVRTDGIVVLLCHLWKVQQQSKQMEMQTKNCWAGFCCIHRVVWIKHAALKLKATQKYSFTLVVKFWFCSHLARHGPDATDISAHPWDIDSGSSNPIIEQRKWLLTASNTTTQRTTKKHKNRTKQHKQITTWIWCVNPITISSTLPESQNFDPLTHASVSSLCCLARFVLIRAH